MTYGAVESWGGDTGTPLNLGRRLRLMGRHVELRGVDVIDLGCGTGEYVHALEGAARVVGVEHAVHNVEMFRRKYRSTAVQAGDIEHLDFPSASFDVALLNEVLEHVPDDRQAVGEAFRVLRPGGHLVIFSPCRLYPFETHGTVTKRGRRLPMYIPFIPWLPLRFAQRFLDFPARNYWPWELTRLVRSAGFAVEHTTAIWQTFEGTSTKQPKVVGRLSRVLRCVSFICERIPGLRRFGVSQVVIARKPGHARVTDFQVPPTRT